MVYEALYKYLQSHNITVYQDVLPSNTVYPAISYETISVERESSLTGFVGLIKYNIEYTVYAETRQETRTLEQALITALEDYSGDMNGVNIQQISVAFENDGYNKETNIYLKKIEFEITIKEE